MSERTDWHWKPGDGMTLTSECHCELDVAGSDLHCCCPDDSIAEDNFMAGWNAAVDHLEMAGILEVTENAR